MLLQQSNKRSVSCVSGTRVVNMRFIRLLATLLEQWDKRSVSFVLRTNVKRLSLLSRHDDDNDNGDRVIGAPVVLSVNRALMFLRR